MSNLKTLKDLELYSFSHDGHYCNKCNVLNSGNYFCNCEGIEIKDLKKEVIKWVKHIKKLKENNILIADADDALRYIFNISEDNLK